MSHPLTRLVRVLAVSTALCVALSARAEAFELFGIHLFGKKKDEVADVIGDPQTYSADFTVEPSDDRGLEGKLKGASTLWKDREEAASGASGLLATARGDYQRLLATLYSEGRYGGTISILIDGREAADIPPDAALSDPASVAISVVPGPLFRFGRTEINNQAPPPTNRRDVVDLPEDKGFVPGEVARSGVVLQAERLAVEAWRQQGHAKAKAVDRRVEAAHDTDTLDASLTIEPGRRAVYGDTTVQGTERMDPAFVGWMTGLVPGREYDPDDLDKANRRLLRLDVFRSARIEEADEIGQTGALPLTLTVQERARRRFGIGASYSTLDGFGFETYWLHRNLFGRAERLRLEAKVAGIGNTLDPEDFTYRVGASFLKPGIYTPDTDFVASLFGDREVLDAYTRTSITAEAGITHIFTDELSGRLVANAARSRFDDDFGRRDFLTIGVAASAIYDSRDDKTNATEGFYAEVLADPFYEAEYGNFAARFTAEGRGYYGIGENNRLVAAGRIKIGSIAGSPIAETPPDKLFFAGGGGSVRGYAYRNIGIVSPTGGVAGGRSLIEGSAELRAKVTETIGLVGFVDAGYVGADSFPKFSEDLRLGVGAGLRYNTGLGPIRVDVAMPLDKRDGDPDFGVYVGLGQAF